MSLARNSWGVGCVVGGAVLASLASHASAGTLRAQTSAAMEYDSSTAMIPMRDGVRLYTKIYAPRGVALPPIIMLRTPYGIDRQSPASPALKELGEDGYIFVFQDNRGRYRSEGQFVMERAAEHLWKPKAIDESTDAYDAIDWLVKKGPPNNGKVGLMGVSYGGWLTAQAMIDPHPALKAVSPQASPADQWLGDDDHHNGAFRLAYAFEYASSMEAGKERVPFPFDLPDNYDWYLRLGALSHVNEKYLHDKIPTWNNYVAHPNYDGHWKDQAIWRHISKPTVPALHVAGWWDQEDFWGPLKIYEAIEPRDSLHLSSLVVGPWNHGGWSRGKGDTLGVVKFGSNASEYFRESIQRPWFAHYLKGTRMSKQPEALVFETGTNRWVAYDTWPPKKAVTKKRLYLQSAKGAGFAPPHVAAADKAYDSYVSDPADPVPYRHRPIQPTSAPGSQWRTWLVEDQRFVENRPDVVTYSTPPLQEDVSVAGDIVAHLFAATSGTDSDWVVKLIDGYPDAFPEDANMAGFELMIANDVFRGRYRTSWEHPVAAVPNKPAEYTIDLHTNAHVFRKGHRIMVQVQSTWFPIIDRNPQKFVPNIFKAVDSDFQKATQRIYHSGANASYVELPVVPNTKPNAGDLRTE